VRSARLRRAKIICSPSYVDFRSGQMQKCGWTWITWQGESMYRNIGIGRKPKTWKHFMSPLQRS
jgi:hypothetical protein